MVVLTSLSLHSMAESHGSVGSTNEMVRKGVGGCAVHEAQLAHGREG
jgi:hypothetical protein